MAEMFMKRMESPFFWYMESECDPNHIIIENEISVPLIPLVKHIMKSFLWSKKHNYVYAQTELDLAKELRNHLQNMRNINNEDGISLMIITHVIESTQYHLYLENNSTDRATDMKSRIICASSLQEKEDLSTLYGIQSIALSLIRQNIKNAINFARKATNMSPETSIWQFILGKTLKLHRQKNKGEITEEEIAAFKKAADIDKNHYFKVHLAQSYLDLKKSDAALEIFQDIDRKTQCTGILLNLAFGLMQTKSLNHDAILVLDRVKILNPESVLYRHYMGIYYMKKHKYVDAAKLLKFNNYLPSKLLYVKCQLKTSNDFNAQDYLKGQIEIYKYDEDAVQNILLQIAFINYFERPNNLKEAVIHLYQAIDTNPRSKRLEAAYNIINGKTINSFLVAKQLTNICHFYLNVKEAAKFKIYIQKYIYENP